MAFNWAVTVGDVVRVILFVLFSCRPGRCCWPEAAGAKSHARLALLYVLLLAFGGVVLVLLLADASLSGLLPVSPWLMRWPVFSG